MDNLEAKLMSNTGVFAAGYAWRMAMHINARSSPTLYEWAIVGAYCRLVDWLPKLDDLFDSG
jgi:hypothetical protein